MVRVWLWWSGEVLYVVLLFPLVFGGGIFWLFGTYSIDVNFFLILFERFYSGQVEGIELFCGQNRSYECYLSSHTYLLTIWITYITSLVATLMGFYFSPPLKVQNTPAAKGARIQVLILSVGLFVGSTSLAFTVPELREFSLSKLFAIRNQLGGGWVFVNYFMISSACIFLFIALQLLLAMVEIFRGEQNEPR